MELQRILWRCLFDPGNGMIGFKMMAGSFDFLPYRTWRVWHLSVKIRTITWQLLNCLHDRCCPVRSWRDVTRSHPAPNIDLFQVGCTLRLRRFCRDLND